jgi:LmbE family N-acetylglucosaminyl deacetylase
MTEEQQRALVIAAHPDDIEFGAAGTVATWVDGGWDVRYVIVTSGQRGTQDATITPDEFGRIREAESVEAAKVVGVTDVTFLRWMDSEVVYGHDLLHDLSRQFRHHRPHRLVAMKPDILPTDFFVNHPDHRAVGTASLDITVTGGTTAAIFPDLIAEGLEPWQGLQEIWLMGPGNDAVVVDITETFERKMAALEAHASQVGDWDVRTYLGGRLAEAGRPHGYAYAESFRVIGRLR